MDKATVRRKSRGWVEVDYLGTYGAGRTATEAKDNACKVIREAMGGYYTPALVEWRGWAVLIYREPLAGWCTAHVADGGKFRQGTLWGGSGYKSKEEAIRYTRLHVAQNGWTHADGDEVPPVLTDEPTLHGEWRSWVRFQRRAEYARVRGFGPPEVHAYAGEDPSRPGLMAEVEAAPVRADLVARKAG